MSGVSDDEEGFRKTARLLELSLSLQLNMLDLGGETYDWTKHETLESLLQSLHVQKDQKGLLFSVIGQIDVNPDVFIETAMQQGLREIVAQTLTRLTYSYQNIGTLAQPHLQRKFHDLTEALIGKETVEQARQLVDFKYNRCPYLENLEHPGDSQLVLKSMDEIRQLVEKHFSNGSFEQISLLAQIENKVGLHILRSTKGLEDQHAKRNESFPYFNKAFALRINLADKLEKGEIATTKSKEEALFDQDSLLANIRTALVDNIVNRQPLTNQDKADAIVHKKALEDFLQKSESNKNYHAYRSSYQNAIAQVDKLL